MSRFVATCHTIVGSASSANQPPYTILIVADDLGMYRCYGQKLIESLNIDRLASGGRRFSHINAGNAVCAPSRWSLMTALHMEHATSNRSTGIRNHPCPTPPASIRS
jgi:arylsulfatase A-like enzyme